MSFFSVPLSGLNASQSALQSISSNLSNVDTDGYKDQNVTFSDLFAQSGVSNGALDPIQTGGGVTTASTTSDFSDGTPTPTGLPSNMALSGNGFFVMQQPNGQIAYSRAGDFTTNNSGELVAPDGSLVMGYSAQNGVVNTTGALAPLQTGVGLTSPATATTSFTAGVNLDATTAVGGTATPSTINTYDSLGKPQVLNVNYTRTAAGWDYTVTVPTSSLAPQTPPVTTPTTQVGGGSLTFDSSGNLTSTAPVAITVPPATDGAAAMNITWNLTDATGKSLVTQTDVASGTANVVQNGSASGTLSDYSIQADGTIQAQFTNGDTSAIGQVALATVTNTQGLQQIGNNLYQVTAGSGLASVGVAGTGGRGSITGGSVEGSNVNEANEFSKLIVAQQAYEANAKAITTFNQVEQATIQIIQ